MAIGLSKLCYIKNTDSHKFVRSGTFCNVSMYMKLFASWLLDSSDLRRTTIIACDSLGSLALILSSDGA